MAQCNYIATDWGFVVLHSALERWRHYLLGHQLVLKIDHASLC